MHHIYPVKAVEDEVDASSGASSRAPSTSKTNLKHVEMFVPSAQSAQGCPVTKQAQHMARPGLSTQFLERYPFPFIRQPAIPERCLAGLRRPGSHKLQLHTMACFLARTIVDDRQITHCISGHFEDSVEYSMLVCTGKSVLELYRESRAGRLTSFHRQNLHDDIMDLTSGPASSCQSGMKKVSIILQTSRGGMSKPPCHLKCLPSVVAADPISWRRG